MAPSPVVFAHGESRSRRSPTKKPAPSATTSSWRPAAPTIPTRSTTSSDFPFIFRGALDVHATTINEEMKLAATHALAALAKEDVPDSVCRAYGVERLRFGPRLHHPQAVRSARAGVGSFGGGEGGDGDRGRAEPGGSAANIASSWKSGWARRTKLMRTIIRKAAARPRRVVFPEGDSERVLRAAHILVEENIAQPILLGDEKVIQAKANDLSVTLDKIKVINPQAWPKREEFVQALYELRQSKG